MPYDLEIQEFVDGMQKKLAMNTHKQTVEKKDVPKIVQLLLGEVMEFEEQYKEDKSDANAYDELFDIANYAFLMYMALKKENKP